MQPNKKKDALTDLVGVASSSESSQTDKPLKDGEAVTPSGEVVTLDAQIADVARKIVRSIQDKKAIERYLIQKQVEKHLKQPPHKGE